MKNFSQLSNPPFRRSDFDDRLTMYALAATAAGVGILAMAQPAEAEIVYTKANKHIGPNSTLHLDLDHDGIADFDLKDVYEAGGYSSAGWLSAVPDRPKNAAWGHVVQRQAYGSALSANVEVGPKAQFLAEAVGMAEEDFSGGKDRAAFVYGSGPWANVTNRYLGLKFVIKGEMHFGWARLNVSLGKYNTEVSAVLTGYAYETVANRPILTGKEHGSDDRSNPAQAVDRAATLGRLARGSSGRGQND